MKKLIVKLWKALGEKGKVATIIGFLFAFPVNIKFVIDYFSGIFYSRGQMEMALVTNVLAMVWLILPSVISIHGPKISIEVKD